MFNAKYIFLILLLGCSASLISFDTLSDLQRYVAQHSESPHSDDEDWNDPDYTSYQKSIMHSYFYRTLRSWQLIKPDLWDSVQFKETLDAVVAQRKKANLSGRNVAHIQLSYPTRVVIWGNLEGSLHSLTRSLTWLQQQEIINDNFEVIKKDYLLVLYGDTFNRSPYTLELLSTIMTLLYRNPNQVICVRGASEDNNDWHNWGLKRELLTRLHEEPSGKIPLDEPLNALFDTFPLALYISTLKDPHTLIRISARGLDDPELDETQYGSFWNNPPRDTLSYYDVTQKKQSTQEVSVKVVIKSETWLIEMRAVSGEPRDMFGIALLDQDRSATAWSILSSPNMAHQTYNKFNYDAFAIVTVEENMATSSILFYNQKISDLRGFKQYEAFNIFTGILLARTTTFEKSFKIGSSLALGGELPIMSQNIVRGISARIQEANLSTMELTTLHLSFIAYNDNYTPYRARQNILELTHKDKVDVILLPTGSRTLTSYLDLIQKDTILTLFPVTGNAAFFKPDLPGLINYGPTYDDEATLLLDHVINKNKVKKFAFFYQDDPYGHGILEIARVELKKRGITQWLEVPYLIGGTDFKKQAETIILENPEAIGFFSSALPTIEFMRQIGTEALNSKILFGVSFLGEESIRRFVKRQGLDIVLSALVPNPRISDLPIVQQYRKQMDVNKYDYDVFSLEAYIATSILIDALDHIEKDKTRSHNKDYSQANIKKHLESLKDYDFMGLKLSFNPQRRSLGTKVWLETGPDTPWIEKNLDEIKKEEESIPENLTTQVPPIPEKPPAEPKKAIE